ncbi:MAG: DUF4395 domain-containing protein [Candidatus Berkelbacteria bacterium]|nr:DUF4395 domain-containing protein [Candidatus Berkelbacteria bacterium]
MNIEEYMKDAPLQIDSFVSRANATFTFVVCALYLFTPLKWPIFPLFLDFYVRGFMTPEYSLLSLFNAKLLKFLHIGGHRVFAPPKIFAAKVGFVFSFLAFIFYISGYDILAIIFIGLLAIFSFLDAFVDYCAACHLHSYFVQKKIFKSF